MMIRQGFVFEMPRDVKEFDHHILILHCLSSSEKGLKNSDLNVDLNPNLCDASAVLYQLN